MMCITVPDMSILAESNQLIKYSSLVTHRLRPKSKNRLPSFSLLCSINWLAFFGGSGLLNESVHFAGLAAPPTST